MLWGRRGVNIEFEDGTQTAWLSSDTAGQSVAEMTTQNQWVSRAADLSSFAGKTVQAYYLMTDNETLTGSWSIWDSDIAITSTDGTVTPIYSRQPDVTPTLAYNYNGVATGLNAFTEDSNTGGDAETPLTTTTYYLGDQIGSARMLVAAGGWPVSSDTFYPYGQEPSPPADDNHYKFTGLERDAESGLDHTQFRQYGSVMGRWMSPDPYMGSYDVNNPQSMNRYSYVLNNPLVYVDPDGTSPDGTSGAIPVTIVIRSPLFM